jgi:DNA polymerase type B, organellar and viral
MIYLGLSIPDHLRDGIKPNHRGSRVDKIIYGADTETVHGRPNSFQFFSDDSHCRDYFLVSPHNARKTFFKWCKARRPNVLHVVYIHNLKFDLPEFLYGCERRLVEGGSEFKFEADGWRVRGLYGAPTFCCLTDGAAGQSKNKRTIYLVDSFSFYRGSLSSAAELYCPHLPKLSAIVDLGQRRISRKSADYSKYAEYGMRDAEVTYHIGKAVEAEHQHYDLAQCISVADLAAHIFRHHYLDYLIPQPSEDIIRAGLDSYHGGKNNITVQPGWYPDTNGLDISSAYPHAMSGMPSFANAKLYRKYRGSARVRSVPPYGVYCVRGSAAKCKWPALFDHGFKPLRGDFRDIWIQGHEVNAALESGELKIHRINGYMYDHQRDGQASAFRNFCLDLYRQKEAATDKVVRAWKKFELNSLSGKTIQTRKRTLKCVVNCDTLEVQHASYLHAGGMFHPFIASAITAHTRARIHGLEHQYDAIHTATDGIFTRLPIRAGIRGAVVKTKAGKLGDLTHESHGDLLLVRNKCYILYGDGPQPDARLPDSRIPGKHFTKFALHGFHANVSELERLYLSGERQYTRLRANTLKQSLARGEHFNDFVQRPFTLKVGAIPQR